MNQIDTIRIDYTIKDYDPPIINKLPCSKRIQIKPKENFISEYNVIKRCVTEQRRSSVTEVSLSEQDNSNKMATYCFKWLNYKYSRKEFQQLQIQYEKIKLLSHEPETLLQIEKDLSRTIKAEKYILQIKNILLAYSVYDPNVGYVQGMNYIVSVLYNHTKQEWATFWLFVGLIEQMEIRDIFQLQHNSINKYSKVLDFLTFKFLPNCQQILQNQQVNFDLFLQQWLLSLLMQFIPFEYTQLYLDGLFKWGITYFYQTALTILKMLQNQLEKYDQIDILILLTSKQYAQLKWQSILALQWDISQGELRVLLDCFDAETNQFLKPRFKHKNQLVNSFFKYYQNQ